MVLVSLSEFVEPNPFFRYSTLSQNPQGSHGKMVSGFYADEVHDMAHGLFVNQPAHGHINPTLGVAKSLVDRGDTITYYSAPAFQTKIEATGASYREFPFPLENIIPVAALRAQLRASL